MKKVTAVVGLLLLAVIGCNKEPTRQPSWISASTKFELAPEYQPRPAAKRQADDEAQMTEEQKVEVVREIVAEMKRNPKFKEEVLLLLRMRQELQKRRLQHMGGIRE